MLIVVCSRCELWILTFPIIVIGIDSVSIVFYYPSNPSKHRGRSLLKLCNAGFFKCFFLLSEWDTLDHFYVWPIWGRIILITILIVVTGSSCCSLASQCVWQLNLKLAALFLMLRVLNIRWACWQQFTGHIFNWIHWVNICIVVYHWLLLTFVTFVAYVDSSRF